MAPADEDEAPLDLPEPLPSRLSAVADVPFERLDPADLALLDEWLADSLRRWPTRPSRRSEPRHSGRRIGLRPTMAAARRTGFEPVVLVRTHPRRRPRRVVMLCDVSRSMQPYVTAYLHLQRAVAVATEAEVFAFSTSLTRLTPALARTSAEVAIEEATARVDDRFGGTRIAMCLRTLLSSGHGEACRGALVVIASDGWDTDPPDAMVAAMSRLRRRACSALRSGRRVRSVPRRDVRLCVVGSRTQRAAHEEVGAGMERRVCGQSCPMPRREDLDLERIAWPRECARTRCVPPITESTACTSPRSSGAGGPDQCYDARHTRQ